MLYLCTVAISLENLSEGICNSHDLDLPVHLLSMVKATVCFFFIDTCSAQELHAEGIGFVQIDLTDSFISYMQRAMALFGSI